VLACWIFNCLGIQQLPASVEYSTIKGSLRSLWCRPIPAIMPSPSDAVPVNHDINYRKKRRLLTCVQALRSPSNIVSETMARLSSKSGVKASMVLDRSLKTVLQTSGSFASFRSSDTPRTTVVTGSTIDNSKEDGVEEFAAMISNFVNLAGGLVQDLDSEVGYNYSSLHNSVWSVGQGAFPCLSGQLKCCFSRSILGRNFADTLFVLCIPCKNGHALCSSWANGAPL
jgi:dynein light chain roadblock-type